jgi:NADH-quinone oxidoreductase subunit F
MAKACEQDADYLVHCDNIQVDTICAFGEACSWPVQSFVGKFKDEFVAKGAADEARRASRDAAPATDLELASSSDH